jgi:hypothetical protein
MYDRRRVCSEALLSLWLSPYRALASVAATTLRTTTMGGLLASCKVEREPRVTAA